jgi:tripartite-type tricarboxylate transporter receptor subunit TctC
MIGVSCLAGAASAQPIADFYRGKHIFLYVPSAAGGGYDAYGRLVSRHLANHIPGNPTIVVENKPGAGGVTAANYLYKVAPKDGTAMGSVQREMLTMPLLDTRNMDVQFDALKFDWFGSLNEETGVIIASTTAPVRTMEDLFKTELLVASTGVAQDYLAVFLNKMIGTRFKSVTGYQSSVESYLALQRGEVQGRISQGWTGDRDTVEPMYNAGKVRYLAVVAPKASPYFPGLPLVGDYAKNDADKEVMDLILDNQLWGRPFALPPGVPSERSAALHAAFRAMLDDPEFKTEAARTKLDISFLSGEQLSALLTHIYSLPPAIVAAARASVAVGP